MHIYALMGTLVKLKLSQSNKYIIYYYIMYISYYTHNINHCRSPKEKLKAKVKVVEKTWNAGRRISCSMTYLVNLALK